MKILCIGDSLTCCYNVTEKYAWTTLLAEKTGSQVVCDAGGGRLTLLMSCGLKRDGFGQVKPDVLFFMGGTNDILVDEPMDKIIGNLTDIMEYAKASNVLAWLGIPPLTTKKSIEEGWQSSFDWDKHNQQLAQLRKWLKDEAKVRNLPVFDFQDTLEKSAKGNMDSLLVDGLHPNIKGYRILGTAAAEIFAENIKCRI